MTATIRVGCVSLLIVGVLSLAAQAQNPGQEDLDRATELKLTARSLSDLAEVIRRCEAALEKGLDDDHRPFAEQLLAATRISRGLAVGEQVFRLPPPGNWPEFRRVALRDLEQALELLPNQIDALQMVARLNMLPEGDRKRAREALDEAVRLSDTDPPAKADCLILKATLEEKNDKKIELLNQAVKIDPKSAKALLALGMVLLEEATAQEEKGDQDEEKQKKLLDGAFQAFEKMAKLVPEVAQPLLLMSQIYVMQSELDKALEVLDKASKIDPDNVLVLLMRARLLAALEKVDEAIEVLVERQKDFSENAEVLQQLGSLYSLKEDHEKAIEMYSKAIEIAPDNQVALRLRGDAYLSVGQHPEAVADLEKAAELMPEDSGTLNNLAWVLCTSPTDELRDPKRAIDLAKKACDLTDYKKAYILSTLAAAYADSGDMESALKWSRKAVETAEADEEGDPETLGHLKEELKSYEAGKPWRELMLPSKKEKKTAEKENEEIAPDSKEAPAGETE